MLGHGGRALDLPLDAEFGFGVGAFVGLAVGFGVGSFVGFADGAAVGFGVGLGVGGTVGSPVAAGWLARGVEGATGAVVGLPGTPGDAEAIADVGLGLASVPDAVGDGEGAGAEPDGVAAGDSPADGCWEFPEVGVVLGVAVGTIAIALGPLLELARCCNSTPPMPSAIVARTRFSTPRLRMSRAR